MPFEKSRNESWLSQLEEHLNRERYSREAMEQSRMVCREFLSYLSKRRVAVEEVKSTDVECLLAACIAALSRASSARPKVP
jgi:hypothetical protein